MVVSNSKIPANLFGNLRPGKGLGVQADQPVKQNPEEKSLT